MDEMTPAARQRGIVWCASTANFLLIPNAILVRLSSSSAFVFIDVIIESYVAEAIKSAHESFYLRIKTRRRPHVWI
jgi:hypothetical protein